MKARWRKEEVEEEEEEEDRGGVRAGEEGLGPHLRGSCVPQLEH